MNEDKLDEITKIRDEKRLFEIYQSSDDFEIRYSIANLITDNSMLLEMFRKEKDPLIRNEVMLRFSDATLDFDAFSTLDSLEKITYIEDCTDRNLLLSAAFYDEDFLVRLAAVEMISDNDFLLKIADEHDDYPTRVAGYKKLKCKSLMNEITCENLVESRMDLIKDLKSDKFISDIAVNDSSVDVRLFALKHLNRTDFFFNIMKNHISDDDLRSYINALSLNRFSDIVPDDFNTLDSWEKIAYIENCTDKNLLLSAALNDDDFYVRIAAIEMISNKDFLLRIADEHDDYETRFAVYEKLNGIFIFGEKTWDDPIKYRLVLVKRMSDEKFLEDIARNEENLKIKKLALRKLNKPDIYLTLANTLDSDDLSELFEDIVDESMLGDIAVTFSSDEEIVENAVNRIANPSVLVKLYRNGSQIIQDKVMKKLLFGNVFSKEKITDKIRIMPRILSVCDDGEVEYLARHSPSGDVRLEAVRRLKDEDALSDVLKNDSYWRIRREAARRVNDENILFDVFKNDTDSDVQKAAIEKIADGKLIADILINDCDSSETSPAIDEDTLSRILRFHPDWKVRLEAVKRISDVNILARVLSNESVRDVRIAAFERIADGNNLEDIARNCPDVNVRSEAVKRISNQDVLADVLRNESYSDVRIVAAFKTDDKDILSEASKYETDNDVLRVFMILIFLT